MLFKLSNTLAKFKKYDNIIFSKKFNIFVIIYLENMLIYNKNFEKIHIKIVC